MSYWVRVFCTDSIVPPVRAIRDAIEAPGDGARYQYQLWPDDIEDNADSWGQCIVTRNDIEHLLVEIDRDKVPDIPADSMEFLDTVDECDTSPEKDRVTQHLAATNYVVSMQLLQLADDGLGPMVAVGNYFIDRHGGLFHADDMGFCERADSDEEFLEVG